MKLIRQVRCFFLLFIGFCAATIVEAQSPCFTVAKTSGCVPFTIVMLNCSGYPSARYDYGETPGQMNYENANIHTYTKPGVYSITQLVSQVGNSNNVLTKKDLITVYGNDEPTLKIEYCTNYRVKFTATASVYESNQIDWGNGTSGALGYGKEIIIPYNDSLEKTVTVTGWYPGIACGGTTSFKVKPGKDWKAPVLSKVTSVGNTLVLDYSKVSPIHYKIERTDPLTATVVATDSVSYVPGNASYTLQNIPSDQNWILQMTGYDACGAEFKDIKISSLHLKGEAQNSQNVLSWDPYRISDHFVEYELKRDGATIYKGGATSFTDLGVVCNNEYSYQLITTLDNDRLSLSDFVKLKAFTKNAPPVVSMMNSTVGTDSIQVSWAKALVETNYYDVFAIEGSDTILLKDDYMATSFRLPITKSNLDRCYFVKYTDLCGNRSQASGPTCLISLQLLSYDKASGTTALGWTNYKADGVAYSDYSLLVVDKKGNVINENELGNVLTYTDNIKDTVNQVKTYKIKASSAQNPAVSYSNTVTVEQTSSFFIPNAFTPNGDGLNDVFMPKGRYIVSYKLGVYNRWGELVFASDEFSDGWDGTINGVQAPAAVYSYVIDAADSLGKSYHKKGEVTLVR